MNLIMSCGVMLISVINRPPITIALDHTSEICQNHVLKVLGTHLSSLLVVTFSIVKSQAPEEPTLFGELLSHSHCTSQYPFPALVLSCSTSAWQSVLLKSEVVFTMERLVPLLQTGAVLFAELSCQVVE